MKTHKEIAQRLKQLEDEDDWAGVVELIYELDPPELKPKPEPGTIVWWSKHAGGPEYKYLGIVADHGEGIYDAGGCLRATQDIEWTSALIAGPMQTIVDVPPVSESPEKEGPTLAMLRHKAKQYDSVVEAFSPADGGQYRHDVISAIMAVKTKLDRLREALDHALKGDLDPEDRAVIAQILDGGALQEDGDD